MSPVVEGEGQKDDVFNEELLRLAVGIGRGLGIDLLGVVAPGFFRASAELPQGGDRIGDVGAAIFVDRPLLSAGVVVDKESAHIVGLFPLVALDQVLVSPRHSVGDAAHQLPLVFHRRHVGAQINLGRQLLDVTGWGGILLGILGGGAVAVAAKGDGVAIGTVKDTRHGRGSFFLVGTGCTQLGFPKEWATYPTTTYRGREVEAIAMGTARSLERRLQYYNGLAVGDLKASAGENKGLNALDIKGLCHRFGHLWPSPG